MHGQAPDWRLTGGRIAAAIGVLASLCAPATAIALETPPNPSAAASSEATAPATTVRGVTVTPTPPKESRFEEAYAFVRSHGAPARSRQLVKWAHPLCPVVAGLSAPMNAFIAGRVSARAASIGAPVDRRGKCAPNVEILFTTEPQKLMDLVAARRAAYLGYHYPAQARELKLVKRPVEARYLTATRGADGDESLDVASGSMANIPSTPSTLVSSLLSAASTPSGCAGSRLTHCLSSNFANALIVVDGVAVIGQKIGPLADYIAMLALTHAEALGACNALPSIFDLFAAACGDRLAPTGWTRADTAYLKGLYRADLELELPLERSSIADHMVRDAPQDANAR